MRDTSNAKSMELPLAAATAAVSTTSATLFSRTTSALAHNLINSKIAIKQRVLPFAFILLFYGMNFKIQSSKVR